MQQKQATGVDTKAMLPIFSCGFMVVAELFLPWFSMPVLKYSKLQTSYTLWNVSECVDNIQKSIRGGGKLSMELLTAEEIKIDWAVEYCLAGLCNYFDSSPDWCCDCSI